MGLRNAGDTYMGFRAAMLADVGRPVLRFAIEAVRGLDVGAAAGDASTCEVRLLPDVVGPTALHQPASDWLPVEDAWAILPRKPRCQRPEPELLPGSGVSFLAKKPTATEAHSRRIVNTAAPRPCLSNIPRRSVAGT